MFLLKKTLTLLLLPVSLILLTSLCGLFFLWFTRIQSAGKILVTFATITLGLLSFQPVAHLLLRPLETEFPVLDPRSTDLPKYVVVLSGGQALDGRIPAASRLNPESLVRTVEAISILRRIPDSKIIFSGAGVFGDISEAETMAEVAKAMGVSESVILLEARSKNTEQNAAFTKELIGTNRLALVTSAGHMPRAMKLFRSQSLQPLAAPVGQLAKRNRSISPYDVLPNATALWKSEHAWYEYLALIWLRISTGFSKRASGP